MFKPTLRQQLIAPILFLAIAFSGWASAADPPSRVARLAYVSGAASWSPGGEREWGRAIVNRPLVTGDQLWVERGARAELQLGAAAIRLGGSTSVTLLNLDDRTVQLELTQGTLNIRVRGLDRGQVFEVDTPSLAYSIRRPGSYRIQVDPDGVTTVMVRAGLAEVYGEGRAFLVRERQALRFHDSGLRDYQTFASWPIDELDRWSSERDRRWDHSPSRRYVSAELIGYQDLDQYGTWRQDRVYGFIWVPRRVSADWAPYRDGHWAWIEPWGWTWMDDAPWGFAPSHYGRWIHLGGAWAWVPGPVKARPVYAPALVAFVTGGSVQSAGGGAVGWFPLGPREVYRPSYPVSREYFTNVNTSNTAIAPVNVASYYNNRNASNLTYVNQQVPGAVIAVLAAAFAQSRPVARETVQISRESVARAPVAAFAPVAPVQASVLGPAAPPSARPPERRHSRPVVAQTAPPPPPVPFAARQSALAANAGKPLDPAAVAALKAAAPVSAPAVKVVQATQPVAAPAKPASAPASTPSAAAAPESVPGRPASAARRSAGGDRSQAAGPATPASTPLIPPPSAAAPGAAPAPAPAPAAAPASAVREGRKQRAEEEGGGRRRPGLVPNETDSALRATPAVPATPALPATRAAPALPPASVTAAPAAPATRAEPMPRATPALPAEPAAPATPATPATRAAPAVPAEPAAPSARPATRVTPSAPAPAASSPAPRDSGPVAGPERPRRGGDGQPRGRAGDEARPPAEAGRLQPSAAPAEQRRPPAAAPSLPAAPVLAPQAPAAPRAAAPPATPAAGPDSAAAAASAAAAQRRGQRARPDDTPAAARDEAASGARNPGDRGRRRPDEEGKR